MALKLSLEEYRRPMDNFPRENSSRNSTVYDKINKIEHSKKSLSYFKKKNYFKRNILKIRENFLGEW